MPLALESNSCADWDVTWLHFPLPLADSESSCWILVPVAASTEAERLYRSHSTLPSPFWLDLQWHANMFVDDGGASRRDSQYDFCTSLGLSAATRSARLSACAPRGDQSSWIELLVSGLYLLVLPSHICLRATDQSWKLNLSGFAPVFVTWRFTFSLTICHHRVKLHQKVLTERNMLSLTVLSRYHISHYQALFNSSHSCNAVLATDSAWLWGGPAAVSGATEVLFSRMFDKTSSIWWKTFVLQREINRIYLNMLLSYSCCLWICCTTLFLNDNLNIEVNAINVFSLNYLPETFYFDTSNQRDVKDSMTVSEKKNDSSRRVASSYFPSSPFFQMQLS